jgi:ligand-binding sensor domain-containing protein/signal transduction histidine kinase/DNA-binding response OmpR family regulator
LLYLTDKNNVVICSIMKSNLQDKKRQVLLRLKYIAAFHFLLILHSHANAVSFQEDLQFQNITSIEGLSNNTVFNITQDSEGFIWIATGEGLNKYDGQSTQTYYTGGINSIPGNLVMQVDVSSEGYLLVGTEKGVCYYRKETDDFHPILHNGNSLGYINQILKLSTNSIMIASRDGLFIIENDFHVRKINDLEFRDLSEYKRGVVWGVWHDEILLLNEDGEIIRRYTNEMVGSKGFTMSLNNVSCTFKDSRGTIWFGTRRNGIGYYQPETDEFISLQVQNRINLIEDNFVREINEDKDGRLWIGTESGLFIYDIEDQKFDFYGQSFDPSEGGLNDKAIYSIFRSRDDIMWVGTYFGGVNFSTSIKKGFRKVYADGGRSRLSGNAVSEIIETRNNKLWIGTEDGGISIYDPVTGDFQYIKHHPDDPHSLSSNNVHALEEDVDGNIWIGTFIGGLNKYDSGTGRIETIDLFPLDSSIIQAVFSVFIDSKDRIWSGGIGGLFLKEAQGDRFNLFKPEFFRNNFIYHIAEDHEGNIWICTYNEGIYKCSTDLQITNYQTESNLDILSNRIVFFLPDSRNILWFGTVGGGLIRYDPIKQHFKSYSVKDGLPNNTVYAIVEDKQGLLWLSTNKGISVLDPQTEEIHNFTINDGLIGNQYNFKSGLLSSNGRIYFGAVNGMTYFNPKELENNNLPPVIHFTDFKVSNTSVDIGKDKMLSSHINYQESIDLKYRHNVFTIDYVALNYFSPGNIQFSCFLEGLENNWNYVGNKKSATYTNLSPGRYTFHLKAENSDGVSSIEERTISINIHPPFWMSGWGYILYAFVLISITFLLIRLYIVRQKEKLNVKLADLEKNKNKELSQHRLNFFTYISHEFKTPLTLIIATLEQMMSQEEISQKQNKYGTLMRKSAMRLLFLINQLMDFRKIETDHASIVLNKGEIVGFIKSSFEAFYPLMEKLSIKGEFSSNIDSYIVYFDPDKLEKILSNLISNSCKSMKESGTISVLVKIKELVHPANPSDSGEKTSDIVITIKDDGPGLSPSKLKQIFQPFYSDDISGIQSSGIGLSLVKSLVKYLNGHIDVRSSEKKGTKFTIQLPLIHNPSPNSVRDEIFVENNSSISVDGSMYQLDAEPVMGNQNYEDGGHREYELLIVEDNLELSSFLANHFSRIFRITTAFNGEEALEQISNSHPDLIISDIMMPVMNGYDLCYRVKETFETCHIPIILLTAKTGEEGRIEGLYKGADAYIGKPFNLRELDLQVRNIIKARESIRKNFASFDSLDEPVSQLCSKDQLFVEYLVKIVHNYLDDGQFDVDTFCQEVNVSRTLLHMKLKKITGLSTTEFIKSIRLNEAKKMLMEREYSVSEIAYRVGFNDPAYFSRSFKKKFNASPSSFGVENS